MITQEEFRCELMLLAVIFGIDISCCECIFWFLSYLKLDELSKAVAHIVETRESLPKKVNIVALIKNAIKEIYDPRNLNLHQWPQADMPL